MNFEDLHYFLTVAKHLNFTRASEELYISQPTLSKKIARLEKDLNTQLFHRNKHTVQLTEAGNILFSEGQDLENHIHKILNLISQVNKGNHFLKVAFLDAIDIVFLPMLNNFRQQYPAINLEVSSVSLKKAYYLLEQNLVDVIIALDFGISMIPEISVKEIYHEGISLVLPIGHWFLNNKEQDFKKLKDETFLFFSPEESMHSYEQVKSICATWVTKLLQKI